MNPLASAAVNAGLIDRVLLAEFRRWRTPIEIPDDLPEQPTTMEEAAAAIEHVLQSDSFVLTRETDLHLLRQYLKTQESGALHVEIPVNPEEPLGLEVTTADFLVSYGKTSIGEYILPWRTESIALEMTNGMTYLEVSGRKVFFKDVREAYYGDMKAFMVCTVSSIEQAPITALLEAPRG